MTEKQFSYLYGLILSDGYLSKQKEKIVGFSIEVSIKDIDIIEKLSILLPLGSIDYRNRNTNFKQNYQSVVFRYNRSDIPRQFVEMGFPIENKTENAAIPNCSFAEIAFWRGVIDGDGSLGLRKSGISFISLATSSEFLKNNFCLFMHNITGKNYNPNRNVRDNFYNVGCNGSSAKKVIDVLYSDIDEEDIFLERKYQKMKEVLLQGALS